MHRLAPKHAPPTMSTSSRNAYRAAIGRRISLARTSNGKSQDALASAIGVSAWTLRQWEHGASMPNADDLGRLCDEIGCSADWLVGHPDSGESVYLISARCEQSLLNSTIVNEEFRDRHARLATIADDGAERCASMEEFLRRLIRIATHRESLPIDGSEEVPGDDSI